MLAHLCLLADADTCVIDSLKDAALKLSDDETGAGWNQARQIAIEAGTELLELHHPRKAQEGNRKPRKLDDLYGSRWIPAGAGSVISLWGQAGDPVVDLTHLKPVVTTAGPWQMTIDGETGIVSIDRGVDLVEQIRYRKEGITAVVAARLLTGAESPGKAAIEKARRKLDRKVAEGLLVRHDGRPGGFTEAFTQPGTWHRSRKRSRTDHAQVRRSRTRRNYPVHEPGETLVPRSVNGGLLVQMQAPGPENHHSATPSGSGANEPGPRHDRQAGARHSCTQSTPRQHLHHLPRPHHHRPAHRPPHQPGWLVPRPVRAARRPRGAAMLTVAPGGNGLCLVSGSHEVTHC